MREHQKRSSRRKLRGLQASEFPERKTMQKNNKPEGGYMTIDSKKRKQLLALFLSAMMASSFAALAACDDDTDNTTDTETEDTSAEKDTARLTNGSFEFYDDNNGKNLIITQIKVNVRYVCVC